MTAGAPMPNPSAGEQFDAYAGDYDRALGEGLSITGEDKTYFIRGRAQHLRRVFQAMGLRPPASVMDFGCGTGSATPALLDWPGVLDLVGVDVSSRSLDVAIAAHASARARFCLMDDYVPDGSLDLVYCNGVFHHVPLDERAAAVQFIFHSLRPGGLFALFENNPWNPGTRLVMRRIPFDRDAITLSPPTGRRLVRQGGFEVLRTDFLFYFPRALRFLRPLERLGMKVPLGSQYLVLGRRPE